jgi:His/Glu/Gln/Arg/opine family amino acid ABC transporter permease subunit
VSAIGSLAWGDAGFGDELVAGLAVTLSLAGCSYVAGLILGLIAAVLQIRTRLGRWIVTAYVAVGRGLPELIVVFVIYYGSSYTLRAIASAFGQRGYAEVNAFLAGTIALALICGSFATTIFRAALAGVPRGQYEAALSLGLRRVIIFLKVTGPQMLRLALPALGNLWVTVLKETAVVTLIGLEDLLRFARIAAGVTRQPFTFYAAAAVLYLVVTMISMQALTLIERRSEAGITGAKVARKRA